MDDIKVLRKLEGKCFSLASQLQGALEVLGKKASEILGYEVNAEMCNGDEIEFRKVDEYGYTDAFDCIRIEEIIEFYEGKELAK